MSRSRPPARRWRPGTPLVASLLTAGLVVALGPGAAGGQEPGPQPAPPSFDETVAVRVVNVDVWVTDRRRAPSLGQENREFVRAVDALQRILQGGSELSEDCIDDSCRFCGEEVWWRMMQQWEAYAADSNHRVETAIDNLSDIVDSLGGLPGRKALFYVSSGLQLRPGVDLLEYLSDMCRNQIGEASAEMWRYNASGRLEQLTARANANRVTLHTLDAAGLRPDASSSVDFMSLKMRPSSTITFIRRANLQDSLHLLADRTGGRAIFNANQPLANLERGLEEQWQGYSLGFYPQRPPDDRTHKLEVELRDRPAGVSLRFRRSYRDRSEAEKLEDRLLAALRLGVEANPLAITAAAGSPTRADQKLYKVPLTIAVPAEHLVTAGADSAPVIRLFLVAEDEDGGRSEVRQGTLRLVRGSAMHEVGASLMLRRGRHRIVVGVRDEIGEALSVLGLEVSVG